MFSFFSAPHSFFVSLSSNREGKKSKKLPHRNRWERERERGRRCKSRWRSSTHCRWSTSSPPSACKPGWVRSASVSVFFFFLHYFLVLIHFVVTICFMRTRLCFDYLSLFKVIWETKTRERNRGWERKNNFLLSWEFFFKNEYWFGVPTCQESYCSNSKKKIGVGEALRGCFLCVYSPKLALERLLEKH